MFGSHLSIAGSMVNALREAQALGLDTVQVFTKNQQQWKARPLDPGMVSEWSAVVREIGFDRGGPADALGRRRGGITSHASYLINLAAPAEDLWEKSVDLMVDEVERCEALGIPFLVHHPGAFTTSTLDEGLARIAAAYKRVFARTRGYAVVSCLEGTVGAGSQIGGPFEELARLRALILDATGEPSRVGFCLDTCHMHAAGYDMATRAAGEESLAEFDRVCGLDHLRAFHINDSKGACGSHLDRHDHIGHGLIGGPPGPEGVTKHRLMDSGFAAVVNHPRLAGVPKHLETPKEETGDGRAWDTVNVARLRALIPGGEGSWPAGVAGEGEKAAGGGPGKGRGPPGRVREGKKRAEPRRGGSKGQQSKPSRTTDRKKAGKAPTNPPGPAKARKPGRNTNARRRRGGP
jgi:deoxyribonuclease-4